MRLALTAVLSCVACVARADGPAVAYVLDSMPREAALQAVPCPDVPLDSYRGNVLALNRPVKVHIALVPQLRRLEEIVRATAIEIYGRPPSKLVHAGGYSCRKVRSGRRWLSEHSLGNAIDILGVDFAALPGGRRAAAAVAKTLRGPFQVRVKAHWNGGPGVASMHAQFLRLLVERIIADAQFRVVLGPSHRDHGDHFHFDMAPYRLVDVFGEK